MTPKTRPSKRSARDGASEPKQVKKGRKQFRPPWYLPDLDLKEDEAAKEKPEDRTGTGKDGPVSGMESASLDQPEAVTQQKDTKGQDDKAQDKIQERKHHSKEEMSQGKQEKKFQVVQHLDLLSASSSDDMDLDSDHEMALTSSKKSENLTNPPGPEDAPSTASRKDNGAVTLGEGGPGTQLHWELVEYERRSHLTREQTVRREEVIAIVTEAAVKTCPGCEVMCFGSSANGLATPSSDIDLVMTGVYSPNGDHGGYVEPVKGEVVHILSQVLRDLRRSRLDMQNSFIIRRARIPLVKITTHDGLDIDLSICDEHGPKAAQLMRNRVEAYPALRPLVLSLKQLLKDKGFNEVVSGGLGTYALSNMVIAHLMELEKVGNHESDLGALFVSFLKLFGCDFDYADFAVSISRGGIVDKDVVVDAGVVIRSNYMPGGNTHGDGTPTYRRLLVEDYFTGRDISSGTYKIGEIRKVLAASYVYLKESYCVPPLPPSDSPELATLAKLFKVDGKSHRCHQTKRKVDDDQELKRRKKGRYETIPSILETGQHGNGRRQNNPVQLKDLDREGFLERVRAILERQ